MFDLTRFNLWLAENYTVVLIVIVSAQLCRMLCFAYRDEYTNPRNRRFAARIAEGFFVITIVISTGVFLYNLAYLMPEEVLNQSVFRSRQFVNLIIVVLIPATIIFECLDVRTFGRIDCFRRW